MDTFLILVFLVLIAWLFVKQSAVKEELRQLRELADQLSSLDRRLKKLEQAPPAPLTQATAPVAAKPVVTPVQTWGSFSSPTASATKAGDPSFPGFTNPKPVPPLPSVPLPEVPKPEPVLSPPASPTHVFREEPLPPPTPPRSISIEERLGQNWLNKLGIITLVIGLALFLGYQLRTLGPLGKSLIGLTLSLALLAGGLFLERRPQYRIFARAAIGGGWALTFFVTFALYHVNAMQVLHSQAADLILMLLVACAMVWHSLQYKSQVVTSLAFLLAFVTVGISEVTLFSLVAGALLAAGLIFVAAREYWFELGLAGLVGVYVNHFLWLQRVLPNGGQIGHPFPDFFASAGLLLLYWFIFRLFYVLRVPQTQRQEVVSSFTAILNSVGVMSLLKFQSSHPEWAFRGLLVLGVAEFAFAFLARRKWRTAFIVLSGIASILLLAAIPFRFSGANWPLLWLFEAEILFIAGLRMPEITFRRLGILASFAAAAELLYAQFLPIVTLRQSAPDASHHLHTTIALLAAAVLFWLNSEFVARRWHFITEPELDNAALRITSYLAAVFAAIGLWVCVPTAWTIVAWLFVALALGWVADKLSSPDLATQADLLALAAILRAAAINFFLSSHTGALSTRALTITLASVLLYVSMRRKTSPHAVPADYIAPIYSWAAGGLLAVLLWYELQPISVAVAWGIFGLLLFEIGFAFRRNYFRHQGYLLLAASFVRIFFANLNVADNAHLLGPRLYTVVPLIAAYFWVYQRLQVEANDSAFDRAATIAVPWFGTIAAAALLYFEVRPEWVAISWALLAFVLIAVGWLLKRPLFVAQSLTLLLASAIRATMVSLIAPTPLAVSFTSSRVFCISAACAIMLLSLPLAFAVRRQRASVGNIPDDWRLLLFRPEQPFFFIPLALITALLAIQLRAGMITIGWSALGVLTFLFALTVKERSYRLAGLSLLLLGVCKIICVDIWHASPSDRYITLIVMGAALLLVSFLYSRYRETLLKFL